MFSLIKKKKKKYYCGQITSTKITVLYSSLDDVVYVAQHDFKATNDSDLPFKKGDKLKVLLE